jgi:hypothetical protein
LATGLLRIGGLAAVLCRLILLASPVGALALFWLPAAYPFVLGAFLIGKGFKMRRIRAIVYRGLHAVQHA